MSQIAVPEEFIAELQQLSVDDNRPVEEIVAEALRGYLVDRFTSRNLRHHRSND